MLRLGTIPESVYTDYRYEVIFRAYKWDPQVGDHNTVSDRVVLLDSEQAEQLARWAEGLAAETALMEQALPGRPDLVKELGLPRQIARRLGRLAGYDPAGHVRLMRFDFHPTETGWAVSEVNSDVPGGLAEASVWPQIAARYFENYEPAAPVGPALLEAFQLAPGSLVALVHATAYSDDRQVMQFLSDLFNQRGLQTMLAAPDHLGWKAGWAHSRLKGAERPIDALIRFFPLEWLPNLPWRRDWPGFLTSLTPSCNHPAAILTQSKRLPLVWDRLGLDLPLWKELLPETREPGWAKPLPEAWIYKPALGRVGEGISIPEALKPAELAAIARAAARNPKEWIAQRKFASRPLMASGRPHHLCIGVFTVNGRFAGFYGRISGRPRIDTEAGDLPVLVAKEALTDEQRTCGL